MNKEAKSTLIRRIKKPAESEVRQILDIQEKCHLSRWSESDYYEEGLRSHSIFLIAETEFQIVGFMIVRISQTEFTETEADLLNFGVLPDFRRRGIGEGLYKTLRRKLLQLNVKKIWLEVRKSNENALRFYFGRGFQIVQSRKNFYSAPTEDGLLMKLEIG